MWQTKKWRASKSLTIIPTDDPLTIPETTNSGAMLTTKKSGRQSPRLADEDGFPTLDSWFLMPDAWFLILHSWLTGFRMTIVPLAISGDYNRRWREGKAIANALHFIKHDPFDYYAPFWWPRSRSAISVWWRSLLLYLDMQLVTFNGMNRRNSVCAIISTLGK